MEVKSIANGVVIDHVRAGFGMKVLEYLNVDTGSDTVALLMNVASRKHGRKDIIKLENVESVDLNVLGLVDHNATVIHIRDSKVVEKVKLSFPTKVKNVITCKNPRCVTSIEAVPHVFHLADDEGRYRCEYCDNIVKADEN
ncbi:MAG: aspartate carbamoyltransferase regulatory subunit [Oscillospiraceae bacterium]|nr:aspartate carbamoyltransferase regulatory subunit [Oscillospiraceae bacterium]